MFNIQGFIDNKKREASKFKEKFAMSSNEDKAKHLEYLREERLKLEGKAKLSTLQNKEEARIGKAKETLKQNSFLGKMAKGLKQHTNNVKKSKGKLGIIKSHGADVSVYEFNESPFNKTGGDSPFK